MSNDKGIDLTDNKYQPFLDDFSSAVMKGDFDGCIGLTVRGETPGGLEITQNKTNIFFPTGIFDAGDGEQITAAWYFNPTPAPLASNEASKQLSTSGTTGVLTADCDYGKASHVQREPAVVAQWCQAASTGVHYVGGKESDTETKEITDVVTRACTLSLVGHVDDKAEDIPPLDAASVIQRACSYDARHIPSPVKVAPRGASAMTDGCFRCPTNIAAEKLVFDTAFIVARALTEQPVVRSTGWGLHRFPEDSGVTKRVCSGHTIYRLGAGATEAITQSYYDNVSTGHKHPEQPKEVDSSTNSLARATSNADASVTTTQCWYCHSEKPKSANPQTNALSSSPTEVETKPWWGDESGTQKGRVRPSVEHKVRLIDSEYLTAWRQYVPSIYRANTEDQEANVPCQVETRACSIDIHRNSDNGRGMRCCDGAF